MSKVVIIIVNWNTGELLARCLESLAVLPEKERISEVIVVDNASRDTSYVQAQVAAGKSGNRPPVRFIKLKGNAGFARANNIAWERVQAGSHAGEHVLLLNPDTEVKPGALAGLLAALEENSRAGIVGPQLLNPDGTVQPSIRAFPTLGVFVFFFLKLHRLFPGAALWQRYVRGDFDAAREQEVDQAMGAALLLRRELVESLGLFDERFWIWFEEVDLCRRAQQAGWKVMYTPRAEIFHHGGVSFNHLVGLRRAWPWLTSCLVYTQKHLTLGALALLWLLFPIALLLALPSSIIHLARRGA
jgi:GT2 family glycosyltransferase